MDGSNFGGVVEGGVGISVFCLRRKVMQQETNVWDKIFEGRRRFGDDETCSGRSVGLSPSELIL